jgi:aminoglycoside 2''-phosphotransferase
MDAPETYVKRIRQVYPDIESLDARLVDGQDHLPTTLILNEDLIFRFASNEAEVEPLKREASVLSALQGRLPLPIPNPEFTSLDSADPSQIFFGYRRLAGVPLSALLKEGPIPENRFRRIVSQMANLMHALHDMPADSLGVELPRTETREEISQLAVDIRRRLAPQMSPAAAEWAERLFEPFLAKADNFDDQPVVRHGRLTGTHILVEPEGGAVTSVLDFSALSLGDPAMDVAALATIGEAFFSKLYQVDKDAIAPLMWRAQFYKSTFGLRDSLAGARPDNPEANRG